jgi:hypothetical protein
LLLLMVQLRQLKSGEIFAGVKEAAEYLLRSINRAKKQFNDFVNLPSTLQLYAITALVLWV